MKKVLFVVRVDNYRPDICKVTIPTIKNYADKIGAEYIEITERKYFDYPPTYEKMQVYELGKDNDWNILVDADYIIHPDAPDFTLGLNDEYVGFLEAYDLKNLLTDLGLNDKIFKDDGRYIGIVNNFTITYKKTHSLWKPLNMSLKEIEKRFKRMFAIDEYCVSRNLAENKLKYTGLNYSPQIRDLFKHLEVTTSKENKE